jgi:hypothetical protein
MASQVQPLALVLCYYSFKGRIISWTGKLGDHVWLTSKHLTEHGKESRVVKGGYRIHLASQGAVSMELSAILSTRSLSSAAAVR